MLQTHPIRYAVAGPQLGCGGVAVQDVLCGRPGPAGGVSGDGGDGLSPGASAGLSVRVLSGRPTVLRAGILVIGPAPRARSGGG